VDRHGKTDCRGAANSPQTPLTAPKNVPTSPHAAVEKYLAGFAEPELAHLPNTDTYDECLVIPAYRETWHDLRAVWANLSEHLLLILVVNSPDENDPQTLKLLNRVNAAYGKRVQQANVSLLTRGEDCPDTILVDRCTSGRQIPAKQGVGLARKIGADIALALIREGKILNRRIPLTDADVNLPTTFFNPTLADTDAALVYPFRHQATPEVTAAATLYDISMLYYAAGLKWAGSPYGFTTIGSLITLNPIHYAMVRGFPKRNAGEDFYLLNKLAKTGNINSIDAPEVRIAARLSERVPFGTGPGLRKILALANPAADYLFYNPKIFIELQTFLQQLSQLWQSTDQMPGSLSRHTLAFCEQQGFLAIISRKQSELKSRQVFNKFINDWFDGFRTLKFIHQLREHYPSVPVSNIIAAPFISLSAPSLPDLRDHLAATCRQPPVNTGGDTD
jgi:hypothetical protein